MVTLYMIWVLYFLNIRKKFQTEKGFQYLLKGCVSWVKDGMCSKRWPRLSE